MRRRAAARRPDAERHGQRVPGRATVGSQAAGMTAHATWRKRHVSRRVALRARSDSRLSTSTQDIWPAQPGCAGLFDPACPAVPPAPDPVPSRAVPVLGRDARQRRLAQPRASGARLAQRRPGAAGRGSSPYAPPVGLCAEADHSEIAGGAAAGEDRGLAPEPRESTGIAADTDCPGNARCRRRRPMLRHLC